MTSLLMLAALGTAEATEVGDSRPFGLGVQLGRPFGITGKVYLGGRTNAIDFLVGTDYGSGGYYYDGFTAQVAYHWHLVELTSGSGVAIPFRIGVGGFLGTGYRYGYWYDRNGDLSLGARVPFGLDFDLERAPVQFYIELAIRIVVFPGIFPDGDGGIGFRYYF